MSNERCNTCLSSDLVYPVIPGYISVDMRRRGDHRPKLYCGNNKSQHFRQVVAEDGICEQYAYNQFNREELDRHGRRRDKKDVTEVIQMSEPNQAMTHKAWTLPKKETLSMAEFARKVRDEQG